MEAKLLFVAGVLPGFLLMTVSAIGTIVFLLLSQISKLKLFERATDLCLNGILLGFITMQGIDKGITFVFPP